MYASWLSALELALGAAIVIGHNVYRKLPNEVPILFVLGLFSLTVRDGWPAGGLGPATSKLRAVLSAIGGGMRAIVWAFAAFGEEIGYRGYLLVRTADLGGRSKAAYWIGLLVVSVLFGYGPYYKGPAGIVDSGIAGLILGAAYLLTGRNLWVAILGHGFIDTAAVLAAYLGWN